MAALTRWDPFADLTALQDQMNRLFGDAPRRETNLARYAPPVDIYEDAEGITLSAELPGVDPKDIEVKVEDGMLSISGTRKLEREDRKENYHRVERSYGTFARTFSLPPNIDVERIKAENKHGVISIFLPRREESKPRKISVTVQ